MESQCSVSSADFQSEDDQGGEMECEDNPQNWQSAVSPDVLASLTPQEIKRQEVINGDEALPRLHCDMAEMKCCVYANTFVFCPRSELFYTERAHLRKLKVLDCVFYQRLSKDGILPPEDIRNIFTNLEEIIQLHGNIKHVLLTYRMLIILHDTKTCATKERTVLQGSTEGSM